MSFGVNFLISERRRSPNPTRKKTERREEGRERENGVIQTVDKWISILRLTLEEGGAP